MDEGSGFNQPNKYIGQDYDVSSDLNYLNAHYYQSKQGQFVSQDPVYLGLGVDSRTAQVLKDPQQQNSYSYARNNPLVYKDPEGDLPFLAYFAYAAAAIAADFLLEAKYAYSPNTSFDSRLAPQSTSPLGQLAFRGDYDSQSGLSKFGFVVAAGTISPSGKVKAAGDVVETNLAKNIADFAAAHSYNRHVMGIGNRNGREFGSLIQNQSQLSEYTYGVISNPSLTKQLSNGRTAYWDSRLGGVVIYNSIKPQRSTVFRPPTGIKYYNGLK